MLASGRRQLSATKSARLDMPLHVSAWSRRPDRTMPHAASRTQPYTSSWCWYEAAFPHTDRSTSSVSRGLRDRSLPGPGIAIQRVEHVEARTGQPACMEKPVDERASFFRLLKGEEGGESHARVPRPGEPVVPVARATDRFGEGRRGCRHGSTRGRIREEPERDQAPQHFAILR